MLLRRTRRNRKSPVVRSLVQENYLFPSHLIYPLFIREGRAIEEPIPSMPGIYRYSLDRALKEVEVCINLGIRAFALFPVIPVEKKDFLGSESINPKGLLQLGIGVIKEAFPDVCIIADIALDPYTTHGHDGLLNENGDVLNDETVNMLTQMALVQAEAGVDMVAPSDMMDGRVLAIRKVLDKEGFHQISIHAYAAKYASAFYGPFRDALGSNLKMGDKKTYQMNPANQREALLEALLDEGEGADILMVKPALPYLDVIAKLRENSLLPISAYQVSGEYAMIKAAAQNGWIDEEKVLLESLMSIRRAGADMIWTYAAPQVAQTLIANQ